MFRLNALLINYEPLTDKTYLSNYIHASYPIAQKS